MEEMWSLPAGRQVEEGRNLKCADLTLFPFFIFVQSLFMLRELQILLPK